MLRALARYRERRAAYRLYCARRLAAFNAFLSTLATE